MVPSVAVTSFLNPVNNRLLQLVEMTVKKMIGVFDHNQLHVGIGSKFRNQFFQFFRRTEFIAGAVHEQDWLTTRSQKTKIVLGYRRANADQFVDALIPDTNFHADAGAKGKATQND